MQSTSDTNDTIRDVAWMHYVAGLTQAEIANRRGLSKMKVHRLVQAAHDAGIVQIFVDSVPSDCERLERDLMSRYGLTSVTVVPDDGLPPTMDGSLASVASAGARFLHGRLESTEPTVIGIGSGRTMSRVVRNLPAVRRPKTTFVSVTGNFASLEDANPYEVIHILLNRTQGAGLAVTAPLLVDSEEDRELFLRQKSIARALEENRKASLIMIGIGHIGDGSFLSVFGLLDEKDLAALEQEGAVADIAGNLMDVDGKFLDTPIARRMIGLDRSLFGEKEIVAVCSGLEKWKAARAALRSGGLKGLITSQSLAQKVLSAP